MNKTVLISLLVQISTFYALADTPSMDLRTYQSDPSKVLQDSIYSYNTNNSGLTKTYFTYNIKGKLTNIEVKNYGLDSEFGTEKLSRTNQYNFTYDDRDNLVSIVQSYTLPDRGEFFESKTEGHYYADGRLLGQRYYKYNNNAWMPNGSLSQDYIYDSYGNITETIGYTWSSADNAEWSSSRDVYVYDANRRMIKCASYRRKGPNVDWSGQSMNEKVYDGDNLIMYAAYTWDADKKDWRGLNKKEMTYDDDNAETMSTTYIWSDEKFDWVYQNKLLTEYQYSTGIHTSGKKYFKKAESFTWSQTTNEWIPSYLTTYDISDEKEMWYTQSRWSEDQKQLILYQKTTYKYEYDDNNRVIYAGTYVYDYSKQSDIYGDEIYYEFDQRGNLLEARTFGLNLTTSEMKPCAKENFEYDDNDNKVLETIYRVNSYDPKNMYIYRRFEYAYDDNSNLIYKLVEAGSEKSQEVNPWVRYLYAYDDKGREILNEEDNWSGFDDDWRCTNKIERDYNEWDLLSFEKVSYGKISNMFVSREEYFYYSEHELNSLIAPVNRHKYKVMGNMVILDDRYSVMVSDLSGRLIYTGLTDTVTLPAGIYIVKTPYDSIKVNIYPQSK